MARSQYINTFNTTADYNNYIDSAFSKFPNVALDKEENKLKILQSSPNSHLIYGDLADNYTAAPVFKFNWIGSSHSDVTADIDTLNNTFYIDDVSSVGTITSLGYVIAQNNNIKSIKKFNIDMSHVTTMVDMFNYCGNLEYVNLAGIDCSTVTDMSELFRYCSKLKVIDFSGVTITSSVNTNYMFASNNQLTDIYITVESTLMKLTNNLSSSYDTYIPAGATIHYNDTLYKWQNNAWTPQS